MRPAPTIVEELVDAMYTQYNLIMADIVNEYLLFKARSCGWRSFTDGYRPFGSMCGPSLVLR